MYDLLKNWPELEQLKHKQWKIDHNYNHERQSYEFSFKLYDHDLNEIYSIDVTFRQLHLSWYCAVNIDTFFASNSYDYIIGIELLEIIKNKALEIKAIMDNKNVNEQVGRC